MSLGGAARGHKNHLSVCIHPYWEPLIEMITPKCWRKNYYSASEGSHKLTPQTIYKIFSPTKSPHWLSLQILIAVSSLPPYHLHRFLSVIIIINLINLHRFIIEYVLFMFRYCELYAHSHSPTCNYDTSVLTVKCVGLARYSMLYASVVQSCVFQSRTELQLCSYHGVLMHIYIFLL